MKKVTAVLLLVVSAQAAYAIEDTPQNRIEQANLYLKAVPMKEVLAQTMLPVAKASGDAVQAKRMELMLKHVDYAALDEAQKTALVKVFTADEISALIGLYTAPGGKSAMLKMGTVMGKMMPLIMPEFAKAQAAALKELASK